MATSIRTACAVAATALLVRTAVAFSTTAATPPFSAPFPPALYTAIEAAANATAAAIPNPYAYPTNGAAGKPAWATSDGTGWTAGFFPGALWRLYNRTKAPALFEAANSRTAGLAAGQFDRSTHDVGFRIFPTFGEQYRLTGNATALAITLQTAHTLCTRYSVIVGCIQSWGASPPTNGQFEVIADNLMNLELLWFAGQHTQNATILRIANSHAQHMIRDLFQPASMSGGGCVWHLITYSPSTGAILNRSSTPQGLGLNTIWARGQAWTVNGFAIAHRFTQDAAYLATAQAAAECYIRQITLCCGMSSPFDYAALWDFNVTAPDQVSVDTSAAMIAVSGIIEIAGRSDAPTRARLLAFAKTSLDAILSRFQLPAGNAVLNNGTVTFPLAGVAIIYSDYYLLEAATRWDETPQTWREEAAAFAASANGLFVKE